MGGYWLRYANYSNRDGHRAGGYMNLEPCDPSVCKTHGRRQSEGRLEGHLVQRMHPTGSTRRRRSRWLRSGLACGGQGGNVGPDVSEGLLR